MKNAAKFACVAVRNEYNITFRVSEKYHIFL